MFAALGSSLVPHRSRRRPRAALDSRPCCSDNAARRYHAGGGRGTRAATTALLGHGAGDGGDRVLISFEINSEKCLTLTYPVTRPISVRAGYPRADGGHLAYCFGSAGRSPPDASELPREQLLRSRAARRGPARGRLPSPRPAAAPARSPPRAHRWELCKLTSIRRLVPRSSRPSRVKQRMPATSKERDCRHSLK